MPKPKCGKCAVEVTKDNLNDLHYGCDKRKCPMKKDKAFEAACDIFDIDSEEIHPIACGKVAPNEERWGRGTHYQGGHLVDDFDRYCG